MFVKPLLSVLFSVVTLGIFVSASPEFGEVGYQGYNDVECRIFFDGVLKYRYLSCK